MKTFHKKKEEDIQRKWYIINADGNVLGRVAAKVATVLRGKHKPIFSAHLDTGDYVIIVNADKVKFTGNKVAKKQYYRHTGYPGSIKSMTAAEMLAKKPEELIQGAVKGMLPKNKLSKQVIKKLFIYNSKDHPHNAQKPEPLQIG